MKIFVQSIHCEEVVKVYITNPAYAPPFIFFDEDDDFFPAIIPSIPAEEPLNKTKKFEEIINDNYNKIFTQIGKSGMETLYDLLENYEEN